MMVKIVFLIIIGLLVVAMVEAKSTVRFRSEEKRDIMKLAEDVMKTGKHAFSDVSQIGADILQTSGEVLKTGMQIAGGVPALLAGGFGKRSIYGVEKSITVR